MLSTVPTPSSLQMLRDSLFFSLEIFVTIKEMFSGQRFVIFAMVYLCSIVLFYVIYCNLVEQCIEEGCNADECRSHQMLFHALPLGLPGLLMPPLYP